MITTTQGTIITIMRILKTIMMVTRTDMKHITTQAIVTVVPIHHQRTGSVTMVDDTDNNLIVI